MLWDSIVRYKTERGALGSKTGYPRLSMDGHDSDDDFPELVVDSDAEDESSSTERARTVASLSDTGHPEPAVARAPGPNEHLDVAARALAAAAASEAAEAEEALKQAEVAAGTALAEQADAADDGGKEGGKEGGQQQGGSSRAPCEDEQATGSASDEFGSASDDFEQIEVVFWAQCDRCQNWSILPESIKDEVAAAENWFCTPAAGITCAVPAGRPSEKSAAGVPLRRSVRKGRGRRTGSPVVVPELSRVASSVRVPMRAGALCRDKQTTGSVSEGEEEEEEEEADDDVPNGPAKTTKSKGPVPIDKCQ